MQTDFKPSQDEDIALLEFEEDLKDALDAQEKANAALRKVKHVPSFICTLAIIIDQREADTGADPDEVQAQLGILISERMKVKKMLGPSIPVHYQETDGKEKQEEAKTE